MSLQYLSGLGGPKRAAKKAARKEKQKATAKKKVRMSPVTKSRVNKLQIQSKIRKTFAKKAEPAAVEPEEILEEQEKPADFQPEEQAEAEETQAEAAEETTDENAELGIYFPNTLNKRKKRHLTKAQKHKLIIEKRKENVKTNQANKFIQKNKQIGMYYPSDLGKIKLKVPKLKGKLKAAVKKSIKRLKDDKHKPGEKIAHAAAKQALFIPRGAFLAIMLLGKALEKSPIKINLGKKVAEVWDKKNKEIKEFWYKVGGEPDILEKQINKFRTSKISGYLGVEPTTTAAAASITAASPIIVKFLKIVGKASEFAKKNPKILAAGQAAAKKAIEGVAKKNPDKLQSINVVADEISKVLPPDQQAQLNKIRKSIPKSTTDKIIKQAVTEVKAANETAANIDANAPGTPKKTNMLLIGGIGIAVLAGGYLLSKKGKK
jgi:hypothetical protein